MYKIGIGFVWSTTDSDQCGTWLLGAKKTDIGLDGPNALRICSQWSWRGLHRPVQHLLVCGSTDREYRWFYLRPRYGLWTIDLWMHSLFSDVGVNLSEKLVSPPTSMYPYRAYIETLLSYGPAAK